MAFQHPVPVLALLLGLSGAALTASAQAPREAGTTTLARGAVTAHVQGRSARIIGNGSVVYEGEVVSTGPRSVAVLTMADDTRVTLRPNTIFRVEQYNAAANQESAVLTLFRGGLRTVTGFISKRNSQAMRLNTPVATIGIRGTEFDARLCDADCVSEVAARPAPAGRAAFVRGTTIARAASGRSRSVVTGGPVYSGETLVTGAGSYAVVVFRDQSRVTLLPDTEFRVDRLDFDDNKPDEGQGVFSLLRGGLRAVTGLIGDTRHRNYRMNTPVATIGIRGTGFDVMCQGTCVNPSGTPDPNGDGMFASAWLDSITVGDEVVNEGQTLFFGSSTQPGVPVPGMPTPMTVPRPDEVTLPPTPPPPAGPQGGEPGLNVSCFVGNCDVQTPQNTVALENGEAGYVGSGGGPALELPEVPAFQAEDPLYTALEFGDQLNILNESLEGGSFECSVR
jgi:hypothetical protein